MLLDIILRSIRYVKYRYRTRRKYTEYEKYMVNFRHKMKYMEITKNNFNTLQTLKNLVWAKGMTEESVELDLDLFAVELNEDGTVPEDAFIF